MKESWEDRRHEASVITLEILTWSVWR